MKVLVTGGAGYIGSHTCVELLKAGHEVFVIDNLSNGHEVALGRVRNITNCDLQFMNADIRDTNALDRIFNTFKPEAVIHFAGLKAVGESVANPLKYYEVNVGGSISLLNAMSRAKCDNIIFSSSATVYGKPKYLPYDEEHPVSPINPYGRTKLIIEQMIKDWVLSNKENKATVLRYFNPVGAHPSGQIGEVPHGIPKNLMPFIAQVATGKQKKLQIFGGSYNTTDGTGARDYIHVSDLADAHVKTMHHKENSETFQILNIGRGEAITVLQLVKIFENISGCAINYEIIDFRDGDLPAFWANSSYAKDLIDWKANFSIQQMCADTWRWQKNNPDGYV